MDNHIAIKVEHLSKVYKIFDKPIDRLKESLNPFGKRYSKDFYALHDVSFEIKKGETIGIIGKNGAGKSTLLKMITGVLTPTSGLLEVNGQIASLLELGAGFDPEMTGLENIYMNGTIMGYSKKDMDDRLENIIAFADIGDFINQPVKMYSSGMFARLSFSVAVNVEPAILIVDEALSVGDVFFQQKCLYKMKKMRAAGVTILFVSHSLATVKSLCMKAIYLSGGKIKTFGRTEEVCTLYQNDSTDIHKVGSTLSEEVLGHETLLKSEKKNNYFLIDENLEKRISERSGGGEVRMTSCYFYNQSEEIITEIYMNQGIKIRVSFIVYEDIPAGAYIGLLCRNELGMDIFACNSNIYSLYLPELKAGKQFVYEISINPSLCPGKYFFSIGVKPDTFTAYFYDRCFTVAVLTVNQEVDRKDDVGGIIFVKPEGMEIYFDE